MTTTVLHLKGELDLSVADVLEQQLMVAVASADDAVPVDLSAVTYLDSTSVRALLRASSRAIESGKRLYVMNANGITRRVLEFSGVTDVLGLS